MARKRKERRERGDGTIRQSEDGTFIARISLGCDDEGKRIRKVIRAKTRDQLRIKTANELHRHSHRPLNHDDARRITLDAFLEEWLEENVRKNNRRATYIIREGTCRNHIIPQLGAILLADLDPGHIRGLLKNLQAQDVGARTRQIVHITLCCALNAAIRDEILERNVASIVERPKAPKKEKYILNEAEARHLLATAKGDPYEALYVLALTTGMRQGELFALEWSDVDLAHAALRVRATLTEDEDGRLVRSDPKTTSSRRTVDLPDITVEALREHRKRTQGFEGYVFRDSTGGPLRKSNFLRRHFHPLLKEAKLPYIIFHSLRHVANSILLAHGTNLRLLADRLGHSTTRTTIEHYSHVLTGAQREAAKKLDGVFGAPSEAGHIGHA